MKLQLLLVFAIVVFAVDSRYSSRSKHKSRVSSDGDQDPDTHQNQKIFPEEPVSIVVDEAQKLKDLGNDELGPPISPEEFAKARNDSTLTAPPPDGGKAMEESGEYQGDIKLTPKQRAHMGKGRIATWALTDVNSGLWPNGIIPYTIDSVFTERERQVIARAMEEFHDRTCIRFVGRTSETDYYHIKSVDEGCRSNVGHLVGHGQHTLSLKQDDFCVSFGVLIHELMHASGFWHEQTRIDRDNYITIHWENVEDKYIGLLGKDPNVHGIGLPYDYQSVMHYHGYAYSKNGQPTMTAKKEGVALGQYNGFSELDVKGINLRYQCEGGSCIDGVSIGSQCLVFNKDAQTWEEAKSSCEAAGMKLASLTDPAAVLEYTKETYGSVPFYVGGTDNAIEGTWKWVNGQSISTDFPWLPGEPNNYPPNGEEDCLVINFAGGFNDDVCEREKPFICEEGGSCADGVSIGSQCLVFNQDAQTWEEAKSSCEAVGMKLASLTDPATVLEYTKEKYGSVPFYVGGTDNANEGTWKWVNGQPISTDSSIFPWLPGEPNNYPPNGEEDCLVINFAGGFNDDVCQREKPFICEVA